MEKYFVIQKRYIHMCITLPYNQHPHANELNQLQDEKSTTSSDI